MRKASLFVLALSVGTHAAAAQDADWIGTTAAATNQVEGKRGTVQRGLKVGDGVFREEEIRTGQASKAQLLFRDKTVFSIGPNSVVVLDKFVYDPDKKTGEMAVKAVTGAFRFVSGAAPKDKYRINTPAGSIGVRGTALTFAITGSTLTLKLDSGAAELCTAGGTCVKLTQPGTYVVSSGGNTTTPQKVGDAACGATACRDDPSDMQHLVNIFISDINNQLLTGRDSLPPDHPRRGHGFFGPRP